MNRSEYKRAAVAAEVLHGAVKLLDQDLLAGIRIQVASSSGEVLTRTSIFEEAIDFLHGGPGHNWLIDSMSGRRAEIIGAEDSDTGAVLCRLCLVGRHDRMAPRFQHLSPRDMRELVQATGVSSCSCGRRLA